LKSLRGEKAGCPTLANDYRLIDDRGFSRLEDWRDDAACGGAHPRAEACGMHARGVMGRMLDLMNECPACGCREKEQDADGQCPGDGFQAFEDHGYSEFSHGIGSLSIA